MMRKLKRGELNLLTAAERQQRAMNRMLHKLTKARQNANQWPQSGNEVGP
jgi:hypothetical protein